MQFRPNIFGIPKKYTLIFVLFLFGLENGHGKNSKKNVEKVLTKKRTTE